MRSLTLPIALCIVACGPNGRDSGTVDAPHASGDIDAPPSVETSRVFAHSANTLYQIDNLTLHANQIGTMVGIGTQSLTDIAIDNHDHMVGITLDKLYSIDPATGAATLIKALGTSAHGFTSLSYVPDPANPTSDILISADGNGDVWQIDATMGNAMKIGSYGTSAGGKVVSSGDVIGVRGFGIYATVKVGTAADDYLAKIEPGNGWRATVLPSATGYTNIFGLGFWGGKVFGFVDLKTAPKGGNMIQIDPTTGSAVKLSLGTVEWYGAGVATNAPIFE